MVFAAYWRWKYRALWCGPRISKEVRDLIRRMSFENPLRAAPHIQALPPRLRQVLMTPGVRADRMTSDWSLLEDAGIISGMHSDREEDRLGTLCR